MLKKKNPIWLFTLILILIEQAIKIIINRYYLEVEIPIIEPWVYFSPMFNRDYSWFNSMLQLGVGKLIHIILVSVMIILIYLFYRYINTKSESHRLIDTTFAFILAGAICSWIDKVFWDGSLDYIYLQGLFTFDLKDVYINIFIGLVILMLVINYNGIRRVDEKEIGKDFIRFLLKR